MFSSQTTPSFLSFPQEAPASTYPLRLIWLTVWTRGDIICNLESQGLQQCNFDLPPYFLFYFKKIYIVYIIWYIYREKQAYRLEPGSAKLVLVFIFKFSHNFFFLLLILWESRGGFRFPGVMDHCSISRGFRVLIISACISVFQFILLCQLYINWEQTFLFVHIYQQYNNIRNVNVWSYYIFGVCLSSCS